MKYDIIPLKRKMLIKYPFFGSVVVSVDYKENKDIPTAGTDGEIIYYNPEFLEKLNTEEQIFVFAHEVCHIAFNHILRSEGKNSELWNIATDGVINQFLKRDGLKLVPGVVDIEEAINYDAEQLYEKLLQEQQQNKQRDNKQNQSQQPNGETQNRENQQQSGNRGQNVNNQNQTQSQQGNLAGKSTDEQEKQSQEQNGDKPRNSQEDKLKQDVGHDTHSMWEQAVKKHKEQQEKADKEKSLSKESLEKDKTEFKRKQEELDSMGEKNAFNKNLEDKKKMLEELKESVSKQASHAGTSTSRKIRTVNDIGTAKSIIDWRYILRETIKYDVDWSYKNATLEDGVVSANLEEQPMPETEIVLDTSGSINEVLLKNFLRECKNILQHTKLKVGCFDTEFYGFHEIRTEEDIENMQFEGGGGTDFDVAVKSFSRRVENKIIFTDGEASMPDMQLDAIWIVFGGERIKPKGGRVIHITPEQLDRLYSYKIESETKGKSR